MRRRWWRLVVPGTKRQKKRRTCIIHLWCNFHKHLAELFIIHRELLVFFGEMSCVLLLGHNLLRLGTRYWLRAPNSWDIMVRSQVLGRNVGEPVHPIFIGSTRRSYLHPQIRIEIQMGRRIVPISLSQPTIIGLLKIKKEIIIFNSRNYCPSFWRSSLRTCISRNSFIGLDSRPRDIVCKKKIN